MLGLHLLQLREHGLDLSGGVVGFGRRRRLRFVGLGEAVKVAVEQAGKVDEALGELFEVAEADLQPSAIEAHALGDGGEAGWLGVAADQGAEAAAGGSDPVLAYLLDELRSVFCRADTIQKAGQRLALDQPGGPDRNGGEQLQELLGSAGLQLEEPLEVVAVVVRPHGGVDRSADLMETREPGRWASQGVPPLESPANRLVGGPGEGNRISARSRTNGIPGSSRLPTTMPILEGKNAAMVVSAEIVACASICRRF